MAGNLENILNQGDCIPEELMMQFIAGKLSSRDTHLVEKHLLACEFCTDALEGLKQLHPEKSNEIIADLNKKIDACIQTGIKSAPRLVPFSRTWKIAAVISIFILSGGGYWYLNNRSKEKMLAQLTPQGPGMSADTVIPQPQLMQGPNTDQKAAEPVSFQPRFSTGEKNTGIETEKIIAKPGDRVPAAEHENMNDDAAKQAADKFASADEPAKNETKKSSGAAAPAEVIRSGNESRTATAEPVVTESNVVLLEQAAMESEGAFERKKETQFQAISRQLLFERGKANYDQKKYSEAEPDFEKLLNDTAGKYYDDAKWFLALCYTKNHKNAKARKLLKEIANSESVHRKEAFGLLQELQ